MVDRYTRIVLTVIAACLVWICLRDAPLVRPAEAQMGVQSVRIVNPTVRGEMVRVQVENPQELTAPVVEAVARLEPLLLQNAAALEALENAP